MANTIDNCDKEDNVQQGEVNKSMVKKYLAYNTSCSPLKLPEYGRLVLQMVEFALTLENKEERTAYAKKIVKVMGGLNPQMKHVPDYQYKLWDHLAYLSDYKLDIDYPVEIRQYGEKSQPKRLSYPGNTIKLRHYGHLVELLLEQMEMAHGADRERLIVEAAERMRKNLVDWKGDVPEDEHIARDISHYTHNVVTIDDVMNCLAQVPRMKRGRRI